MAKMKHTDSLMLYYLVGTLLLIDGGEVIQKHLTVISSFYQIRPIHFRMFHSYTWELLTSILKTDYNIKTWLSKSLRVDVSDCDDFYMTAYSQSWKMCVYVLRSWAFAPGGLLLQQIVYVHSGDQPPSTDINSGKRDTTTMCECSLTVNISLAVGCPPCQHSHFKKGVGSDRFRRCRFTCYGTSGTLSTWGLWRS